jgi:diguanylate cyclase (GGDEF)-like protein
METQQQSPVMAALGQVVATYLPHCLEGMIDATIQALNEQRLLARSNKEAQACEDFLRLSTSLRQRAIVETVKAIRALLPAGIIAQAQAPTDATQWQLVDDGEVEEMLEARRLVRQLREPLGVLEWRSCAKLNSATGAQAKDRESPLSLEFMVRTLQAQLRLREQPPLVRELFYTAAAQVLASDLKVYFEQVDKVFERFQIEPLIDPVVLPVQERRRAPPSAAPDAPYRAIEHLRAVGADSANGSDAAEGESAAVEAAADASLLQATLGKMQRLTPPEQGWSPDAFLQELSAAGAVLSPRQSADAGVVAELFQHIEQETAIASNVKPALRRLMVPVVQASMLDPAAFADSTHPVRATLDKLMRLCDFSEPANHVLEDRVQQLIDGIVADYSGDSSVFISCDQELEQLLAVQQRAYSNNADRVRQYIRGRDVLEQARQHVARELSKLFGQQAPRVLLDWLDIGWREMLVHELIRQGEESFEWLDDLAVLRQLNGWLQADANAWGYSASRVERAFETEPVLELLRKRMESFLPGQFRHTPVLKQLQEQLVGDQPVELINLPPPVATPPTPRYSPAQQRWRERVQQLSAGDWLVTQSGQHLQLVWANSLTDHYILVDHQGREAGSLTSDELIARFASGWLGASAPESHGVGVIQKHLEDIVGNLYRDIAHARSHDELTGLLNRRSFETAIAQALASQEKNAFIYGHIDQFSLLNSRLGHVAGDAYLKQIAELLAAQLPETATLARIGGADFAVALTQPDESQAGQLAERLRAATEANVFEWEGRSHTATMSVGVVLMSERHDVVNLFRDLQTACVTAKDSGRNCVHTYSDEIDGVHTGLMAIAGQVDDIIERGELSLRVQLIAPAAGLHDQLPHYEVLLVMENDVTLLDFITASERYDRMTKVDRWVLKRVFTELVQHPNFWTFSSGVSINLSGSSLNDDKLLHFIESLFEDYAVPPERIRFEITETAAVANLTKTADLVRYLQRLGCTFAIDDFGTGFSSYEYLKRLPVDFVKIDGSFVKEIERSPSDLAMVKSINEIAHLLGRKTIAEYVETVGIRKSLAELGVDYVQGYGVEYPRPLSECLKGSNELAG